MRCSRQPASSTTRGLFRSVLTLCIGRSAWKPGRRSKSFRRGNSLLSGSSRTPPFAQDQGRPRHRRQPKQKLTKPIKKPKATWVEPKFYADIEYRDITAEGLLRASSFKGLSKGTRRSRPRFPRNEWSTGDAGSRSAGGERSPGHPGSPCRARPAGLREDHQRPAGRA